MKKPIDQRFCHLCGSIEIKGGWCTNSTCSEFRRYKILPLKKQKNDKRMSKST